MYTEGKDGGYFSASGGEIFQIRLHLGETENESQMGEKVQRDGGLASGYHGEILDSPKRKQNDPRDKDSDTAKQSSGNAKKRPKDKSTSEHKPK